MVSWKKKSGFHYFYIRFIDLFFINFFCKSGKVVLN